MIYIIQLRILVAHLHLAIEGDRSDRSDLDLSRLDAYTDQHNGLCPNVCVVCADSNRCGHYVSSVDFSSLKDPRWLLLFALTSPTHF